MRIIRSRTNAVIGWAEAHIQQREAIAARRASRVQAATAQQLAKAEAAALLRAERAKASAEARAMRKEAKAQADALRAAGSIPARGGFRSGAGTPPVRWMAWPGDEVAVTIDGETLLGTVTSIARGPELHVTLANNRMITLAIGTRQERPKRRSPRKPTAQTLTAPPDAA